MHIRTIVIFAAIILFITNCTFAFASSKKVSSKTPLSKDAVDAAVSVLTERVKSKFGDIAEITAVKVKNADRFKTTDSRFEGADINVEFKLMFTVAPDIEDPDTGALSSQDDTGYDRTHLFNVWRVGDVCIWNEGSEMRKRFSDPDSAWVYLENTGLDLRNRVIKCTGK